MKIINKFNLSELSYIHIGPVVKLIVIEHINDFINIGDDYKILGNASNILFKEKQYDTQFVRLNINDELKIIDPDNCIVEIPAGMSIKKAINILSGMNIGGLEEFYPIPGTIGGMLFMNAGTPDKSISDNLVRINTINDSFEKKHFKFEYRYSGINETIISAVFKLKKTKYEKIRRNIRNAIEKREVSQPVYSKSLGSVFKNPPGKKAWELIEKAGFRGKCINGICVSKKHSNFIVNDDNGKADDFLALSESIIKTVKKTLKTKLEYEIEIF